jgi:uncharacterized protein YkwD
MRPMRWRLSFLALVLGAFAAVVPAATQAAPSSCPGARNSPTSMTQARATTLCLLNVQRRRHHLSALRVDPRLQRAATAYSHEMVLDRFFAHVGPDGSTVQERVESAGYHAWSTLGENIAWGSGILASPAKIVDTWMHSPGHRANILTGAYRQIGIGVVPGAPQSGVHGVAALYTTDFARPR